MFRERARFAAAGLRYTSPEVTVTTGTDSVCGKINSNGAHYCPEQRAIAIRIMKHDLRDPFRMNIAQRRKLLTPLAQHLHVERRCQKSWLIRRFSQDVAFG